MKIHTRDPMALVSIVEVEPSDGAKYIGHFTVEALSDFVSELKKKYKNPVEMLSFKLIFQGNGYVIVAAAEEEILHLGVAGCGHGRDGTE